MYHIFNQGIICKLLSRSRRRWFEIWVAQNG